MNVVGRTTITPAEAPADDLGGESKKAWKDVCSYT